MGTIYRATDKSLSREVAVKLVRVCHSDDPLSCERLRREACAAGKVNHPRVAQVYALNFSNGHPFLVMELVPGEDLAQKLAREGTLDERVALRMALDVADGLSALSREGLVHGDIKPGNIVLDRDGNAKLVDFGLSGMTRRDENGNFVGTPNYIAPELLRGAPDTHRSDLYSLGATLYHLLSGRPPHAGATPTDVLKARMFQNPAPLRTCARQLSLPTQRLIMRMLEVNPEKRQASSDAVIADIREALSQLDLPKPEHFGGKGLVQRCFGWSGRLRPSATFSLNRVFIAGTLILNVALIFLLAAKEKPLGWMMDWLLREEAERPEPRKVLVKQVQPDTRTVAQQAGAGYKEPAALPFSQLPPPPTVFARDLFTAESNPFWQSLNLGDHTRGGSTLHMGDTLVIQGSGMDMWKGFDSCRFVWAKASGDYAFSGQIKVIANNDRFAITGLMVKGADPTLGPGLLFGFLGSGELFVQIRQPRTRTIVVVKRSVRPVQLPCFLKIVRRGNAFDTLVATDDITWHHFAACELDLPSDNTIGFSVSPQVPDALATAKIARIRLFTQGLPDVKPSQTRSGYPP